MPTLSEYKDAVRDAVSNAQVLAVRSTCETLTDTVLPPRRGGAGSDVYPYLTISRDGTGVHAVILDGDASSKNRMEAAIRVARSEGGEDAEALSILNHVSVTYTGLTPMTETDMPNRIGHAHVFAGKNPSGIYAAKDPEYLRAVIPGKDQTAALLKLSPLSLLLGFWNSMMKNGVQQPSVVRASTVAVLSDQSRDLNNRFTRPLLPVAGWRNEAEVDSANKDVDPKVKKAKSEIVVAIKNDVLGTLCTKPPKSAEEVAKDADKAGEPVLSQIGVGAIGLGGKTGVPDMSAGVSVSDITRTMSVSLSLLRRIRTGDPSGDLKIRAALVALAIYLDRLAAQDLHLRAGCDLYEASSAVEIDSRVFASTALSVDEARALFVDLASEAAPAAGWDGSVYALTGHDKIGEVIVPDGSVDE